MANEVLTVSPKTLQEMKQYYEDYLKPKTPPGGKFAAKKATVNITAYNSGKVLFQGQTAQQEAALWISKAVQSIPGKAKKNTPSLNTPLPKGFNTWSVIGSDEVGNGSYFGPLTVVAAYVDKSQLPLLKELGVRDSKDMKDPEIIRVAKDLVTFLPHSLLNVMPQKYNAIQPTMTQGKMKAVLHNQALGHVLMKIQPVVPEAILIDQFELPATYFKHIQDQPNQIKESVYFQTKGEGHHLAVAAASIIARFAFLKGLEDMSAETGLRIPSGAGSNVDLVAAKLLKRGGLSLLGKYAKLHFANTQKAQKIAGF
ncbi:MULTISPECIES: ribonuclease HIII [Carnobacterium]|uniref:Ribonuclease HIII n=1 Tax=Carnobacterium antarcticum TaxID=2126436 RepID=A0ABW4NNZ4_9LACT|nr:MULTISPECIES: ribonuclease HIII [unclassified Carnobacterium]ALV22895.1 Ribonuclease HIII [Carnobacterium sp. CP1]QQP70785.1 ribonuclease HIII [Carnobacterium sp. CS13]